MACWKEGEGQGGHHSRASKLHETKPKLSILLNYSICLILPKLIYVKGCFETFLLDNMNSKARNKICVKMLMKPHTCMVLIFVCFSRCPVTIVHKRMAWELRDETVPCGLTNQALPPSVRPGSNCAQAADGMWVACRQDVGGHWYLECRLPTSS